MPFWLLNHIFHVSKNRIKWKKWKKKQKALTGLPYSHRYQGAAGLIQRWNGFMKFTDPVGGHPWKDKFCAMGYRMYCEPRPHNMVASPPRSEYTGADRKGQKGGGAYMEPLHRNVHFCPSKFELCWSRGCSLLRRNCFHQRKESRFC